MLRRVTILALLVIAAAVCQAAPTFVASRAAGSAVLDEIGARDPQLAASIRAAYRAEQPVFIFVPGILGSKLVAGDGKVLWGVVNFSSHDLRYPGAATKADFLDSFSIFGYPTDVYGRFRETIEAMDVPSVGHLLKFPYDWRADLRTTADQFDNKLRTDWAPALKGRHVVIVAHSMGGLMVDWWYKKIFAAKDKSAYGFTTLDHVVFLGTPHRGATSALLSIIKGYQPPNPGRFEQHVYGRLFHDLNDAAVTFPSLYEMFPLDSVVKEQTRGGLSPVDHFNIAAWHRYQWAGAPNDLNSPFYRELKKNLENGKAFQDALRATPCIPNAVYFYSRQFATATTITVRRTDRGFDSLPAYPDASGDGRVITDSAQNIPCLNDALYARPDREEHGALANDNTFIDFLFTIRDVMMRRADARVIGLIKDKPAVLDLMASRGVLLPVPLGRDQRNSEEGRTIVAFNREIVRRSGADVSDVAGAAYRSARVLEKQDKPEEAALLYAMTLGLDESSPLAYHAANNLGLLLLENDAPNAAKTNLELAVALKPIARDAAQRAELVAASENNLGVAYARIGETGKAHALWEKAAKMDADSPAAEHLAHGHESVRTEKH